MRSLVQTLIYCGEKVSIHLSLIACLTLAIYYTTVQFVRYGKNEDLSVVHEHKIDFTLGSKDNPPTFTLCMFLPWFGQGGIYKLDDPHWERNKTLFLDYQQFLRGEQLLKFKNVTKSFNASDVITKAETETKALEGHFSTVNFEEVVVDIVDDILQSFSAISKKDGVRQYDCKFDVNSRTCRVKWAEAPPMSKSHQSPEEICYTRNLNEEVGRTVLEDRLFLNVSSLFKRGLGLNVYIHQQGQLIRHLASSYSPAVTSFLPLNRGSSILLQALLSKNSAAQNEAMANEIEHKIENIIILRKRDTEKTPCDDELINEDQKWKEVLKDQLKCTPAYWKNFSFNLSSNLKDNDCTLDQYNSFYRGICFHVGKNELAQKIFYDTTKRYKSPCTVMTRTVFSTKSNAQKRKNGETYIKIVYGIDTYTEIENSKAYDGETLLSQVGGFIGRYIRIAVISAFYYKFFERCRH